MELTSKHGYQGIWLLIFLSLILLFPSLGKAPLWIYDEVRNAECAREMYERSDWIIPTFNGELRTLKPPLHYYFMFGGFEFFGVTEWGARFFSAIFGVLTIFITWFFTRRFSSGTHALVTCFVLLASTHFLFQFRMSVPDPYLIFLNVASIFTAFAYFTERKFSWLILCAIAMGLGTLAKGPVSIALPGASILAWLIWDKKWNQIFTWHMLVAAVIMLAVAAPWYFLVHDATNGEWTRGFFLEHNVGRFSAPMEGHGGLFIIVPLFVLVGLLPSSVFIGETFKKFRETYSGSFMKLALCVMALFLVFYSVSGTKLPNYPMPCYPFVAILLGYFITKGVEGKKVPVYPIIILLVINLALPIAAYLGISNEVELKGQEHLSLWMLILPLAAILGLIFTIKKNFKRAVTIGFILYTIFNILFFNYLYPKLYSNNPMSKTINRVRQFDHVVAYKIFHPSYTYYLPERVKVFESPDSLRQYMQQNRTIVITREAYKEELAPLELKQEAAHHDLFEDHTTMLLSNDK